MKYLITNIKYSIEQEDIDSYREEENIDENISDEEIKEEIEKSLPIHLIVEPDEDNDDLEEALNNEISDATGWCIETYSAEELVNVITTKLNNFMEEDHEFWKTEFGCNFDEIVSKFGFGYYGEEQFSYLSGDNIIDINTPLEDILNKISEAGDNVEKLRDVIFWIYENND